MNIDEKSIFNLSSHTVTNLNVAKSDKKPVYKRINESATPR
jgi:hypothetical protein